VKATGRKQLIIAGVVTDVCVAFPTLSAIAEGFEVFVVTDASGTFNTTVQQAAWARMSAAGAHLLNWFAVACELQGDWRNDMEGLANLLSNAPAELPQPDQQLHQVHCQVSRLLA
jgi:hypothetical protein